MPPKVRPAAARPTSASPRQAAGAGRDAATRGADDAGNAADAAPAAAPDPLEFGPGTQELLDLKARYDELEQSPRGAEKPLLAKVDLSAVVARELGASHPMYDAEEAATAWRPPLQGPGSQEWSPAWGLGRARYA